MKCFVENNDSKNDVQARVSRIYYDSSECKTQETDFYEFWEDIELSLQELGDCPTHWGVAIRNKMHRDRLTNAVSDIRNKVSSNS